MKVLLNKLVLFLKGMGMGAADVVPGVSGGTIAFITNIYEDLIGSISSFNLHALRLLLKGNFKEFATYINLKFLIPLLLGIATAVLTLVKIIKHFLENEPVLLWSFFFGLILASAFVVGRHMKQWSKLKVLALLIATVASFFITGSGVINTPDTNFFVFLSGIFAIVAMVLPGISGSFILLILGKYDVVINAVSGFADVLKSGISGIRSGDWAEFGIALNDLQILTLVLFILGAIIGLLSIARLLNWLFEHYHDTTIAILTGILIGSLNKVWPWKKTTEFYTDRHGIEKPLTQINVLPEVSSEFWLAILLAIFGLLIVLGLEYFSGKNTSK